jgi:sodium/potassium/calcium exchanger 6
MPVFAPRPKKPRRASRASKFSTRPFYTAVLLFSALAVCSFFLSARQDPAHASPLLLQQEQHHPRSVQDCGLVHHALDKCEFVKRNCREDEAGLIQYLSFYYCAVDPVKPFAFVVILAWLGLLFTTIGIAASDFFSVNLSTIATVLGLSESLAGVTFLALGNGSPDVFSTFAAMGSNSGSMAVGELIGAAGFITAVVAGSMALVREFKVNQKTFVRDIGFFIVAVAFAVGFLSDGHIHLWECFVMIGFYAFYVFVVVTWHAYSKRKSARRAREAASRSHYYAPATHRGNDELEPYRDDPEDQDAVPVGRGTAPPTIDISALERGPRIDVNAPDHDHEGEGGDDDDNDDDNCSQHVAAEMTSSMRVMRPRGRRSASTITPIRPSLVGALEFRSVLSVLANEDKMKMAPIHTRSHSYDRLGENAMLRTRHSAQDVQSPQSSTGTHRSRSHSSGAVPASLDQDLVPPAGSVTDGRSRARSPAVTTVGGKLAPPPIDGSGHLANEEPSMPPTSPKSLHLQIPVQGYVLSPSLSEQSSPATPFPRYTESPMILSAEPGHAPFLTLPDPAADNGSEFTGILHPPPTKPVRWWPYRLLPSPHALANTLFPTLQGWRSKSFWDKLVSLISVPSIFLLVITLPVVDSETTDGDSTDALVEQSSSVHLGNTAAAVSYEPHGSIEPETEWQRYRRHTISRRSSGHTTPAIVSLDAPAEDHRSVSMETVRPRLEALDVRHSKPVSDPGQDSLVMDDDDDTSWNRWLFIVQIFTGPLFSVFIVWANMAEELSSPGKVLLESALASLLCSLVLLAILLASTRADRRPKYHFMFCFLGFIIAVAWISTIAGEVVGVLKALGVILDISEAILGLTVFAVGNSVGDLVADVTVARLGYPVMALSACFGGPMLNILLGIGLGGAYQTMHAANKKHRKHPNRPIEYKSYTIQVTGTLMVSAVVLLITLLVLLIAVPMNKWIMSRRIGYGLIGLWAVGTILNLVIEITGVWQDIA